MRISSFMIGLIVMMLVVTSFGSLMSVMAPKYNVTYNESDMEIYNKLRDMANDSIEIRNRTEASGGTSKLDLVGGFLSDAINALRVAWKSYDVFTDMADAGIEQVQLPGYYKTAILTIILILVVVAGFIAVMVNRDV